MPENICDKLHQYISSIKTLLESINDPKDFTDIKNIKALNDLVTELQKENIIEIFNFCLLQEIATKGVKEINKEIDDMFYNIIENPESLEITEINKYILYKFMVYISFNHFYQIDFIVKNNLGKKLEEILEKLYDKNYLYYKDRITMQFIYDLEEKIKEGNLKAVIILTKEGVNFPPYPIDWKLIKLAKKENKDIRSLLKIHHSWLNITGFDEEEGGPIELWDGSLVDYSDHIPTKKINGKETDISIYKNLKYVLGSLIIFSNTLSIYAPKLKIVLGDINSWSDVAFLAKNLKIVGGNLIINRKAQTIDLSSLEEVGEKLFLPQDLQSLIEENKQEWENKKIIEINKNNYHFKIPVKTYKNLLEENRIKWV